MSDEWYTPRPILELRAIAEQARHHASELEKLADWIDGIAYDNISAPTACASARVSCAIAFLQDLGGSDER